MNKLAEIKKSLATVMKEEFIEEWLNTPNQAFGNSKPIDLIEQGDTERIQRMIYQLESGVS